MLELLHGIQAKEINSEDVLLETIKQLIIIRNETNQRIQSLLTNIAVSSDEEIYLSSEAIVKLIKQHLDCPLSSRLIVLVVAAAYNAASDRLGGKWLPLKSHYAADKQTKSLGDLEITLLNDNNVFTCYEMKMKRVTILDINEVIKKIYTNSLNTGHKIDNYIFITTESIDKDVEEYAAALSEKTGGVEIVVLDCLSFLRHFLHLFHRLRMQFLEEYQKLVLEEPTSAVSVPLKEAFLALRQAAMSNENDSE